MRHLLVSLAALALIAGCSKSPEVIAEHLFDGSEEVAVAKFAFKDLNPEMPSDWDGYNYLVMEYRMTSAQRFQLGFVTADGYSERGVMSYVPGGWNRFALPLKFYRQDPAAAVDLAATYNQPRYTGWVNIGGRVVPLHGVDSLVIRMQKPIGNPLMQFHKVYLAVEDPGDLYMEKKPAIDEFGQSNLVDYPAKARTVKDLEACWREEENDHTGAAEIGYSKFGGYRCKQVEGTGFFRTQKIDGRWWFVDPEGYLFLSVGVDCIHIGGGGEVRDYDKRSNMYKAVPSQELLAKWGVREGKDGFRKPSFGLWNLYRRYGDDFRQKAMEMTIARMDRWGVNTIGNWSNGEIQAMNRKAFMVPFGYIGLDGSLMGLCDVYAPDYLEKMEKGMRRATEVYKDNPWLIGYFLGNEPSWVGREKSLCQTVLEGADRPIKAALEAWLARKGDNDDTRREFIIETFRTFLTDADKMLKKCDPNHLNLGIRFGSSKLPADIMQACAETFDVFSFNCYELKPPQKNLDRILEVMDVPAIIGEYHFGTVDRGLAQSLWQVDSQEERGVAYRYYTEQGYAHPGLVGTAYFQWCDQDITGRGDGENYNCGLVDVTDRPYKEQTDAMIETAKRLYDVHAGNVAPFDHVPETARPRVP